MSIAINPYDQVEYHAGTFSKTHPQRLASVARLFGLNTPSVERCRVLELGCGDGANLIPMAYHMRNCQFVGIDLAQTPIDAGVRRVQRLGLSNVQMLQADVAQLGNALGQFDYIIAHGLYSWVPDSVRPHILRVAQELLTENGVAYISYNALPGCRLRHLVRELLQFRFGEHAFDPSRINEVRNFLQEFASVESTSSNSFQSALKAEINFVQQIPDFVLFHDDLAEYSKAFYLHEFLAQAKQHQMQYLGEATIHEMLTLAGHEAFDEALSQWSNDDWISREQYLDFCKGTRFRQTLLCREHHRLDRRIDAQSILSFQLRTALVPLNAAQTVFDRQTMTFGGTQRNIELTEPIAKLAIIRIGERYPSTISFDLLFADVFAACRVQGIDYEDDSARAATLKLIWALVRADQIELIRDPVIASRTYDRLPEVTSLVADALVHKEPLSGSLHRRFELQDQVANQLTLTMDGTRSLQDLSAAFRLLNAQSGIGESNADADGATEKVRGLITFLHRQGALRAG